VFGSADIKLSEDALGLLKAQEDVKAIFEEVAKQNVWLVTKETVETALRRLEEKKIPVPVEVQRPDGFKPVAKEIGAALRIREDADVTGKSRCTGTVGDFVGYFRNRYEALCGMLRQRASKNGVLRISAMRGLARGREVRILGMVVEKKQTKNGHLLVTLDDEEAQAKVLVLKDDRRCMELASQLLLDEVVAIDGSVSEQLVICRDITWPDLPIRPPKTVESDACIALLSDLHVGSRFFMQGNFQHFIQWLCGRSAQQRELAGRVKYVVIAGDLVDGIGIYPKQERELVVKDIYEQYRMLGEMLNAIPDYIEVVLAPGNHDAVRRAEPQPQVAAELRDAMKPNANIRFAGSPCAIEVDGLRLLAYHGTSLDSVIASLKGMSYAAPEKPMTELLKRRCLSPIYGENPIVPEAKDYMLVGEPPDILHMGHVHKNGYALYHGTSVINSGTWQARTDYQVRQGHVPSPCVLPLYSMRDAKTIALNFSEGAPHG
jgi:DNA polymerase II small subunit